MPAIALTPGKQLQRAVIGRRLVDVGLVVIATLAHGLAAAAPTSNAEFQARVAAVYDFEPHKLSRSEMQAKSGELDQFWESVKADTATLLPLLRRELGEPSRSAFFYYDGSKLLLSLSRDRADQALALRAIPKADLQDIQHDDYLRTVHSLAGKGFDTTEAALRILAFPDFQAFIPQHALTLGQDYSLIYILFPMDENLFVDRLSARLPTEKALKSQKSILLALWYACTPNARAALERFSTSRALSSEVQKYASELLDRKPSLGARVGPSSLQDVRTERRKVMSRPISDESLLEFDRLTEKILAKL